MTHEDTQILLLHLRAKANGMVAPGWGQKDFGIAAALIEAQAKEIERLGDCLKIANAQTEEFERLSYLRGDESEALRADAYRYRHLREGDYLPSWVRAVFNDTPDGIDASIDAAMQQKEPG